jgi:hypothetical protein
MRRRWLLITVVLVAGTAVAYSFLGTRPAPKPVVTLLVNGQADGRVGAARPGELSFQFSWNGSEPITGFDLEHEKYMHLVIVRQDLSSYAHVHPILDPATGWFRLAVNQPVADPDNRDAPRAFPRGGRYHLFAEVKPASQPYIAMFALDVAADGADSGTAPLAPDPIDAAGTIQKIFDGYRVKLRVSRGGLGKLRFVTLAYQIEYAPPLPAGRQGLVTYEPVKDLENWLSMPGHAILLSKSGDSGANKVFRHIHAAMGEAKMDPAHCAKMGADSSLRYGPDLEFYLRDEEIPPPGVYKLWGQFKHRGKILTFPFVISL